MKKIVVAPDSFKGTMSSTEAGAIISKAARTVLPLAEIITVAIADGGEGSVDAFLNTVRGRRISCEVTDPDFSKVTADYALVDGDTAVIEIAQCAGLNLSKIKNPALTTTFGVGELISHAVKRGAKKILLALGGSATNDGGAGMACALGAVFRDKNGDSFVPTGGTLSSVRSVDATALKKTVEGVEFKAMCDVNNPLYGKNGAAYVYAPQKGADGALVKKLDEGLKNFSDVIKKDLGMDVSSVAGAGAAGGLGAGCVAFLSGELVSGIDAVLNVCRFEELAVGADLIVTGEGSFDRQSLMGKVVQGISKRKPQNAKLVVIAGRASVDDAEYKAAGIFRVYQTSDKPKSFEEIKRTCRKDLYDTSIGVFQAIRHQTDLV